LLGDPEHASSGVRRLGPVKRLRIMLERPGMNCGPRQNPSRLVPCSDLRQHVVGVACSAGGRAYPASALAVLAARPAAGPALAFFQLLLGPANAARSGHLLLGILDPADELVARQGRDVLPGSECRGVGDQRVAQVCGQLVHHPTGHWFAAHSARVTAYLSRRC